MRRDAAAALLVLGDPRHDLHALDQQILQPIVDLVDPTAEDFEIGAVRLTWFRSMFCGTAIVVGSPRGKIKENIDMRMADP